MLRIPYDAASTTFGGEHMPCAGFMTAVITAGRTRTAGTAVHASAMHSPQAVAQAFQSETQQGGSSKVAATEGSCTVLAWVQQLQTWWEICCGGKLVALAVSGQS